MFAKFHPAALQNFLILQQIFSVCEHKFARVGYFAIVGRKLKAMTSRKKALLIQFSFPGQKIKKC